MRTVHDPELLWGLADMPLGRVAELNILRELDEYPPKPARVFAVAP